MTTINQPGAGCELETADPRLTFQGSDTISCNLQAPSDSVAKPINQGWEADARTSAPRREADPLKNSFTFVYLRTQRVTLVAGIAQSV